MIPWGAGHSNSTGPQGLKPIFLKRLNVAAEAATHKDSQGPEPTKILKASNQTNEDPRDMQSNIEDRHDLQPNDQHAQGPQRSNLKKHLAMRY
jgi:hypothetical protein